MKLNTKYFIIFEMLRYCFLLPGTTPEKYNVIMAGYLPGDGTNYIFKDSIKRFMMQIDMWLSKLDICPGYIIMIECRYSTFSHYTSVSFNVLKKLCIYFQVVKLRNLM